MTAVLDIDPRRRRVAPPSSDRGHPARARLAPDVERDAVHRLGLLSRGLLVLGLTGTVARYSAFALGAPLTNVTMRWLDVTALLLVTVSTAMMVYTRRGPAERVLTAGLAYEVFLCTVLACTEAVILPIGTFPPRPSFLAIVLLTFPLVVPATPRRRLITALACLALLPVETLIAQVIDPTPLPTYFPLMYFPTLVCGFFGILLSRVVHRMNVQIVEARRLGSYELVERIGGGGMGEVWRARHRLLVRPAAVKVVRPELLEGDAGAWSTSTQRFAREAQATSVLESPHTVALYDFGITDEGAFFYAMELLDGFDLQRFVEQHGPMPASRAVHVLQQLCRSLADAHHHGLVHRDIKPANVFLCRLGVELDFVKVLDFGLVKTSPGLDPAIAGPQAIALTRADAAAGTPAFMAPEIALGREVDARTDLYSVGCVGFWLLTGELVFSGRTAMEVASHHIATPAPPPSARTELDVPPDLDALILACLAKDPTGRPPTAANLHQRLAALALPRWTESEAEAWWTAHAPRLRPTPTIA